jgi:hypothetical protein
MTIPLQARDGGTVRVEVQCNRSEAAMNAELYEVGPLRYSAAANSGIRAYCAPKKGHTAAAGSNQGD